MPACLIVLELGYSIDYEDEKDTYEFDAQGKVVLLDGTTMAWEDVKRNGFDYLSIYNVDNTGQKVQFFDRELA